MELNFLNKLESSLFKKTNPEHEPVSGRLSIHALIGGFAISLVVFIMQMTSLSHGVVETISGILLIGLLAYMAKQCLPTINKFEGWGGKIGFSAYMLAITFIAFYLAMWALIIGLLLLILWVVAKLLYGDNSKSKKWKVTYEDGREVDAKETGRGPTGETIIEDEDGNTHVVN